MIVDLLVIGVLSVIVLLAVSGMSALIDDGLVSWARFRQDVAYRRCMVKLAWRNRRGGAADD